MGVVPPAHPPIACSLFILDFARGGAGTFADLADAEVVLWPRNLLADRQAGMGFDYLVSAALPVAQAGMPPMLAAAT